MNGWSKKLTSALIFLCFTVIAKEPKKHDVELDLLLLLAEMDLPEQKVERNKSGKSSPSNKNEQNRQKAIEQWLLWMEQEIEANRVVKEDLDESKSKFQAKKNVDEKDES